MIGAGSYGRVFMGLNMDTGGLIAIKELVFSPDNVNEVAAMQQEINLMRSLDHPNIVKYLGTEMGDTNNMLYIFTEWVPGGSLQSLLKKFGKFDEAVTRKYTFQILQGLQFLHLNRVVHRDIKGANILIDDKGTVKLADFGASKQLSGTMATMQEDNMSLRGTPYFMAPEVITQTGHGRKADVWSVGCTVLQMCTGLPPWKTMKFGSERNTRLFNQFPIVFSEIFSSTFIPTKLLGACSADHYRKFSRSFNIFQVFEFPFFKLCTIT